MSNWHIRRLVVENGHDGGVYGSRPVVSRAIHRGMSWELSWSSSNPSCRNMEGELWGTAELICGVISAAVMLIGRFGLAADNDIRAKIIFQIRERKIRIYNFTITH
jgi:hypothetical protein